MIIDTVMLAYEFDALSVRLRELRDVVDLHVIVTGTHTFSGEPLEELAWEGIELPANVVTIRVDLEEAAAKGPWEAESFLRDQSLELARNWSHSRHDLFIVADVDEIPHPQAVRSALHQSKLGVMTHRLVPTTDYREWYMDWRGPDHWQLTHQPVIGKMAHFPMGAQNARVNGGEHLTARGWHLSSLGDAAMAHRKLGSFAHTELDTPEFRDLERLAKHREEGIDIIGRFKLERTTDLPGCASEFPHLLAPKAV